MVEGLKIKVTSFSKESIRLQMIFFFYINMLKLHHSHTFFFPPALELDYNLSKEENISYWKMIYVLIGNVHFHTENYNVLLRLCLSCVIFFGFSSILSQHWAKWFLKIPLTLKIILSEKADTFLPVKMASCSKKILTFSFINVPYYNTIVRKIFL